MYSYREETDLRKVTVAGDQPLLRSFSVCLQSQWTIETSRMKVRIDVWIRSDKIASIRQAKLLQNPHEL